jgi:hypothetical protein
MARRVVDDEGLVMGDGVGGDEPVGRSWVDDDAAVPAPRGEGEPLMQYLERMDRSLNDGHGSTERSAELLGEARDERTTQVEEAIAGLPREPEVSETEADALLRRLDRTRDAIMRGRVFGADSTDLVRRERGRRSAVLRRRSGT